MHKYARYLIVAAIGAILASAGVSVLSSWQAWAVITLAALNGAIPRPSNEGSN